MDERTFGFRTRALHAGTPPDGETGARALPLHLSTSFVFDSTEHAAELFALRTYGNIYTRIGNPTVAAFEEKLASLEGGLGAVATASGLSAQLIAILSLAQNGDHLVASANLYGGTITQFGVTLRRMGIETTFVPGSDLDAVRGALRDNTKAVFTETIGNPKGNVADLAALAEIAHGAGVPLIVDNTFATPYLQRPLTFGADVVVHSTTKYVGGHSDVLGGFVATSNDELAATLKFHQYAIGAVPGPFDCYLLLRGLKTLGVRMDRHCANARAVAAFLVDHPSVEKVYYPGLADHPGYEVATAQMSDFGGMVSFTAKGGVDVARKVCESTSLFTLAESLGGVESLIEMPSAMTHASTAGSTLEPPVNLIRLSVGIEDIDDLLADLAHALSL